jgi:hypothetical protein
MAIAVRAQSPFLAILAFAKRVFGTETAPKTRGFEPFWSTTIPLDRLEGQLDRTVYAL